MFVERLYSWSQVYSCRGKYCEINFRFMSFRLVSSCREIIKLVNGAIAGFITSLCVLPMVSYCYGFTLTILSEAGLQIKR
jgi:hypothetical protein